MRYVAIDCEKRKEQQQTNPKMTTHSKHFKRKEKEKNLTTHSLILCPIYKTKLGMKHIFFSR